MRAVAVACTMVGAVLAGFATAVGVAAVAVRPAQFLSAGLLVTALVGAAGLWLLLRREPTRGRIPGITVLAATLVVLTLVVLAPLRDPRSAPEPVGGLAYWDLDSGSRLAHVRLAGARPARLTPVVVLHGGPGIPDMADDAAYFGQLTGLGFDVYVYDQLGSGRSTRLTNPADYGIDRDVGDLEEIRQEIKADRMVLVGHSYGATLAAHYLAAHPDRVERLILSSPGALDPGDSSGSRATAGLGREAALRTYTMALHPRALLGYTLLQVNPAAAHAYLDDPEADARNDAILTVAEPALHCRPEQSSAPARGSGFYALQYPQSATAAPLPDVRPQLTGLTTPALVFKGSCDYLSWSSAIEYRQALPATDLVYLEGAGHNTYQDRPTEVLAVIEAFLTGRPLPVAPYSGDTPPAGYRGPRQP
jgi:proline iminopeptidase